MGWKWVKKFFLRFFKIHLTTFVGHIKTHYSWKFQTILLQTLCSTAKTKFRAQDKNEFWPHSQNLVLVQFPIKQLTWNFLWELKNNWIWHPENFSFFWLIIFLVLGSQSQKKFSRGTFSEKVPFFKSLPFGLQKTYRAETWWKTSK